MDNNEPEEILIEVQVDAQTLVKPVYPNLKSLFTLFFVLLFYMLIGGLIEGVFIINTKQFNLPLLNSLLSLIAYIIILLVTIRYAVKKSKQQQVSAFNISFNKIQGWLVPVVIISTLALFVGLERVSNLIPMSEAVQEFFGKMIKKDPFSLFELIIAAPILEEILCRGIVLNGLLKNYTPDKAILISAIFFGVIHMNPWQAFPAFFGGLFLGWVFYKTQSVIPGMIIHMTINAASSIFLFLPKNQQGFLELLGEPYYIMLCIFSAIIFISGCLLIHRRTSPITSSSPDNPNY